MSKPTVLAEPVFVGREAELRELQSLLNSVIEGKGRTVFVSGEAGSGKTRLTREFLQAAIKQGAAVMAGWCLSDSQVPYFPFMEAFNNYYASQNMEEDTTSLLQPQAHLGLGTPARIGLESGENQVTSWLTGQKLSGKAGALSPEAWKDQVFIAVSETLHAIAAQNPLILFVEDIHWADSASLSLLHYIARAVNNSEKVLLLATFRSDELTADAEGHPHPLAETLRLMRREELFAEINLSSLNQTSVSKMAESMIGGILQPELAGKLTGESRGNPLFIVESLRMLHERKSLVLENSEWRLAVDELGIPNKIKDVILRRLACLKYGQRRVLDAASVIGEEFDVDLLSTVLGQDYLEILEILNVVAHSTSLVRADGNFYRFDHARSRETLYEELALPLKRGYHNKIAEKLESIKRETLPLSDIAYHYAQAGNKEKAVKYALASGQNELAKSSNVETIKHFKYVIQAVGESKAQEHVKEKETAIEGLGNALFGYGMFKESVKTFEQLAYSTQDDELKFQALIKAITGPGFGLGDAHTMKELIKKAEPYAAGDRWKKARLLAEKGRVKMLEGTNPVEDYEESFKAIQEEWPLKQERKHLAARWLSSMGMAINHPRVGKFREAIAESLLSLAWTEESGESEISFLCATYAYVGNIFNSCFLPDQALILCAKGKEIYQRTKIGTTFFADFFSSWALMQKGDFPAALTHALAAAKTSDKTDSNRYKAETYSNIARIYALMGNVEGSNEFFAKLSELGPELLSDPYVLGELTKAVHLAVNGQWNESNRIFEETILNWQKRFANTWGLASIHIFYGWSLKLQGRLEEAAFHFKQAEEFKNEVKSKFDHTYVQMNILVCRKVDVGSEFEMQLDIINASSKEAQKVKVEGLIFPNFDVEGLPTWIIQQKAEIDADEKSVDPFKVETVKLRLKAKEATTLDLKPAVTYIDDLGHPQRFEIKPMTIIAKQEKPEYEALPGRITTGYRELDRLLMGGIPEGYAVALAAPSTDERQLLINRFLEAGLKSQETTLYITCETGNAHDVATKFQDLYLVLCNPQADLFVQSLPRVFKLKGIENLTDIDIALTKLLRTLSTSTDSPKRACVDLLSDVLLQHHAVITRKWLSSLLANLKHNGFTTFAIIDPSMHAPDEYHAVLSLFEGQIVIEEKADEKGVAKVLRIVKLYNQRYSENELILSKEKITTTP